MKRFLLWSFDRGSIQYDVICGLILLFIFLTPRIRINDRPDYMRISSADPAIKQTIENGIGVFTVKLENAVIWDNAAHELSAIKSLEGYLKIPITPLKVKPIYTTTGRIVAYAIWVEEVK